MLEDGTVEHNTWSAMEHLAFEDFRTFRKIPTVSLPRRMADGVYWYTEENIELYRLLHGDRRAQQARRARKGFQTLSTYVDADGVRRTGVQPSSLRVSEEFLAWTVLKSRVRAAMIYQHAADHRGKELADRLDAFARK